MPFIKCNCILILTFIFPIVVSAAEHGGEGASKESGASNESEKSSEGGETKESNGKSADREWAQRTSKLNILAAKMKELKFRIQEMIEKKNSGHAPRDEKGNEIDVLGEMTKVHKELVETLAEYTKESDELRFRYPEEGTVINRKYVPLHEQSLEQIEKEMGLDGDLTRTKAKIDKKYAPFRADEPPKKVVLKQSGPESTVKEIKKHKGSVGARNTHAAHSVPKNIADDGEASQADASGASSDGSAGGGVTADDGQPKRLKLSK
jgi:hypothetical protein